MGKLHTLRRAIERDPTKWRTATGAVRYKGVWDKGWQPTASYAYPGGYAKFIKKVLRELSTR